MCVKSVRRHVQSVIVFINVHIVWMGNFCMKISLEIPTVTLVHKIVTVASIPTHVHYANNITGVHTVRTTVKTALLPVTRTTVALQDAIMDIIDITIHQRVVMNVIGVLRHAYLVRVYHIAKNV